MNRKKGLIYAGLAATFTVFALARFPVALAADWLIPQKINLAGSEGSLWQGRASALGLDGMAVQQDIAWKFRPGDLARGQLAWDVSGKFAGDSSKLVLSVSPVSVELRDVQLALPLEPLLNLDAKLKSLRLGGMVKLRSASFSPLRPSQASVLLENVFSALVPKLGSLGTAEINLASQADRTAQWTVRPIEGGMAISGNGGLDLKRGSASGTLTLKPDEKLAGNLKPVLSLLQEGPAGEYSLTLPGG